MYKFYENDHFCSFHWVLVALEAKKMIAFYLNPMFYQPCDDLKEMVNMCLAFHFFLENMYYLNNIISFIWSNVNQPSKKNRKHLKESLLG